MEYDRIKTLTYDAGCTARHKVTKRYGVWLCGFHYTLSVLQHVRIGEGRSLGRA